MHNKKTKNDFVAVQSTPNQIKSFKKKQELVNSDGFCRHSKIAQKKELIQLSSTFSTIMRKYLH